MVEQLFGSKTRVKLLHLFFNNPNRSFYVREITRKIDEQINSVRRELANLLSIGIISSENNNNKLYYEVNQKYEHYKALSSMFNKSHVKLSISSKDKSSDEDEGEFSALAKIGNIDSAILTGQFTRDTSTEVDLLVVGDVNQTKLNNFVSHLEAKESKEIRFAVISPSEFDYRLQVNDRFLRSLLNAKKQVIIDKQSRFKTK